MIENAEACFISAHLHISWTQVHLYLARRVIREEATTATGDTKGGRVTSISDAQDTDTGKSKSFPFKFVFSFYFYRPSLLLTTTLWL